MIVPPVRKVEISPAGAPSLREGAANQDATTIRISPVAWEEWSTNARWYRVSTDDGRTCRLLASPPLCVLESTTGSGAIRVCGPHPSGPALFFATIRATTFAPATLATGPLLDLGPPALEWLRSGRGEPPPQLEAAGALLRFEHGWGPDLIEEAAWLRIGNDWVGVSDLTDPSTMSGDTHQGGGISFELLSMRSLALSISLAMASDLVATYSDEALVQR